MRVGMWNRGLHSHAGGDLVQVAETAAALRKRGVFAYLEPNDPLLAKPHTSSIDIAHITHCNFTFSQANFNWAEQTHLPVVLTPTFYDSESFGVSYVEVRAMLESADAVIPFSQAEAALIEQCTGFTPFHRVLPNGTDTAFHATDDPMRREGVLAVAARAGTKGTEIVKELCEELKYPYMIATGYAREQMPGIYKKHRVFIHAGDKEVMSLVIGEALCANCRVLATNTNPGNEWYPGLLTFTPHFPANKDALKELLVAAYTDNNWCYAPNEAARKLTWSYVANELITVYKKVLA